MIVNESHTAVVARGEHWRGEAASEFQEEVSKLAHSPDKDQRRIAAAALFVAEPLLHRHQLDATSLKLLHEAQAAASSPPQTE